MSKALIEKMIRARERGVEAGGHRFTIRRPTDADALAMQERRPLDFVCKFVVGWDLTEGDLIPGGGPEKIPFDLDLWSAWIADHPELWEPLATEIVDDYRKHVESREAVEKN